MLIVREIFGDERSQDIFFKSVSRLRRNKNKDFDVYLEIKGYSCLIPASRKTVYQQSRF